MSCILVDTSVWVDHFRHGNDALIRILDRDLVLIHPLIIGELTCGTPPSRTQTLTDLASLQPACQASAAEVLAFIDREHLFGLGCGIVDMHLLASALITQGARLWTLASDRTCSQSGSARRNELERTE
ncbi:type II toxin-antitoxin system VapC family toxin [Methyloversatilis universalis]|uniref:type II toxin-antitoxin system VapC family toxin n=1 Tax=Methyloversatilis universalis TaxID=378211 RepID=UPI0003A16E55|nr:VapC toxin family PIN domain ribonuclease [Methyloversatilis universalis]